MLTSNALQKLKDFIRDNVSYGKYRIGTTYYQVPIHNIEIVDDKVNIYLLLDNTITGTVTINQFQLYDKDNNLFAEKTESITKNDTQGILVKFSITVQEV
ncbi:hypothetical protein [Caloramator australicus]|uniref:Uncharacterized protein n=1 Tax=Caloramator australicus RC3 TaxID=857293 RepID=I7J4R0_9CLOT|nr:hypothetical protein [Caloramator australicus]CCJ32901.1 hypothetical protein CAAU_0817 [Caloramator australicus RC3]